MRFPLVVRSLRCLSILVGALMAAPMFLGVAGASPSACDTSWASAVSGSWTDSQDWTNGVPTSATNACITVAGNYTVSLLDSQSARSLTLGSAKGSTTQTLDLAAAPGHNAVLSLDADSTIHATGELVQDSQSGAGYTAIEGGGTLANAGVLDAKVESSNLNYLEINLDNKAGGTVSVLSGEFRQDDDTTTTNHGAFTVKATASAEFTMTAGVDQFINSGGTVANSGAITLSNGASWSQDGGKETGNPVTMFSGTLSGVATGPAGQFDLIDSTGLSGTIAASETVHLLSLPEHNSDASLAGGTVVNHGTIVMDSQNGGGYTDLSGGTLTNDGTLDTQVEGSQLNYLEANLVNNGTVEVKSGEFRQDDNTTTTNAGNLILDAGARLNLTAGSDTFDQKPDGTMTFEIAGSTSFGTLNLSDGATFHLDGGTADPTLTGSYNPPAGTEFDVITGTWGAGTYATIKHNFTGDYSHPTFLGLVKGA